MSLITYLPEPARVFDFRGQQVRYDIIGEGYPLVLLHGTPFSSVVWRRIAPWLAEHYTVYYYDLLGYGCSEKREGQDVSLGIQPVVFAGLLDYWGLVQPPVVAHDFGGTTALRTHLLNNHDYRSLTLIDPVAIGPSGSPFVQAAIENQDVFTGLPAYIHEAILRAYIGNALFHPLPEADLQRYLKPWQGAEGQAAFYRQIAQMSDRYTDEVEQRYGEIRCPVSILWGECDEWIPLSRGRELASRIPNAAFRIIPETKHLVQEDAPEAIVAAVLDFLHKSGNKISTASLPG
jgi:pimeloyl-ACP methyl ester carboxylesterase